jgi:type IV secretion system protein VirB6
MDEKAPITWLINEITAPFASMATTGAAGISNVVTPLVSIGFGIYLLLITLNYLRGAETELVLDFGLRMLSWAVVIGIGLNVSAYADIVIPIVTGLGGDNALAVGGSTPTANSLDTLALYYLDIIDKGDAAITALDPGVVDAIKANVGMAVKKFMIMLGLVPFLVAASITIVVAQLGSLMVAMVGPLYFAFLLFPATRQYFSAWVNTAISYALIPIFVAVIATFSIGLSQKMLSSGTTLNQASFTSVFLAVIGNLILLFLLKQVSAIASSLSAGGINAGMISHGISAIAKSMRDSARGSSRDVKSGIQGYKNIKAGAKAIKNKFNNIKPG